MSNYQNKQSGFGLIEVMLSFSILIVVSISLIRLFPLGLSINREAENASTAAYFAQDKIEELFSSGYSSVATGTIEAKHPLSISSFERETIVNNVDSSLTATSTDTGIKKISVNIYYKDAVSKSNRTYSINSLISQK